MSNPSEPLVDCSQCRGSGKQPLQKDLLATFRAVKKLKHAHANEVRQYVGWKGVPTATNNHLRRLLDLGLLTRKREGAHLVYSVNPLAKKPRTA